MILELRVFNKATKTMYYLSPLKPKVGMIASYVKEGNPTFDEKDPIMLKTPMGDKENTRLWEGDICDCGVQTSYGLVRERGIVVWRADLNSFTLNIQNAYESRDQFDVVDALKIGNIYENPELMKKENAKG